MITNWLGAGSLIVARLRDKVPALAHVTTLSSLAELESLTVHSPTAFVIWQGDNLGDTSARGYAQMVVQQWMVVIAVRSARDVDTGAGILDLAGVLVTDVLRALMGWQPTPDYRPFVRVQSPAPGYNVVFGYFPLSFETKLAFDARIS